MQDENLGGWSLWIRTHLDCDNLSNSCVWWKACAKWWWWDGEDNGDEGDDSDDGDDLTNVWSQENFSNSGTFIIII